MDTVEDRMPKWLRGFKFGPFVVSGQYLAAKANYLLPIVNHKLKKIPSPALKMARRTRPTNPTLRELIDSLKKLSSEKNILLWKRVAKDLEMPRRSKRVVNLSRINLYTKENEIVVVPGKVLGDGVLGHKLTIAAFSYSKSALEKINNVHAKAISIKDLMEMDIEGKGIRIIG